MKFELIIITPEKDLPGEAAHIVRLFRSGLKVLHVRKPGLNKRQVKEYIHAIPSQYHKRLVLHSHYALSKQFDLKGIHLTEKNRKKAVSRASHPKHQTLSASFHSIKELNASKRPYDYVFLSPIFDSTSKKNYRAKFSKDELKHLLDKKENVVALGGVDNRSIAVAKKLGFSGVAVLGYVWRHNDPQKAFNALRSKIK